MATEKQIAANRRNALASTGPQSAAGKLASSQNALRHGLTAENLLVNQESVEDFDTVQTNILAAFPPRNNEEAFLAGMLVQSLWALNRATRLEQTHYRTISLTTSGRPAEDEDLYYGLFFHSADRTDLTMRYLNQKQRQYFRTFDRLMHARVRTDRAAAFQQAACARQCTATP